MKKILFLLLCMFIAAPAAMAAGDCKGDPWPADIDKDCRVQFDDYSRMAANWPGEEAPWDPNDPNNMPYPDPNGVPITVQAEDMVLSGDAYNYYGTSVGIAYDVENYGDENNYLGKIYYAGTGYMTFPNEIPAGDYFLRMQWAANWVVPGSTHYMSIAGVTEVGSVNPGFWHGFHPNFNGDTSPFWRVDTIAGPNMGPGSTRFDGGSPSQPVDAFTGQFGHYITVEAGNLGNFTIGVDETSPSTYYSFEYDWFELIPAIVPPGYLPPAPGPNTPPPIKIQAEDCNLSGELYNYGSFVRIAYDVNSSEIYATGVGDMTLPVEIPAGEYILTANWRVNSWDPGEQISWMLQGVTENGSVNPGGWHACNPPEIIGDGPFYIDQIAGPAMGIGSTAFDGSGYEVWMSQFGESITVEPNNLGNITISVWEPSSGTYNSCDIDWFELTEIVPIPGDFDDSGVVDVNDLAIFVDQWLYCNDPNDPNCNDIFCLPKPFEGISEYSAYAPEGTVVIDGNLADWPALDYNDLTWCTSKWIAMDKIYYGMSDFLEDVYMCIMYDAANDIVYGAVTAHDMDPIYGYDEWNTQDNIEIYIQGDPDNDTPESPMGTWTNGQQFMVGLDANETTTFAFWPDETPFSSIDPGLNAVVKRVVNAPYDHTVTYEFAAVPYDNFGGWDSSTTVQTDLAVGSQFGFDIVLSNYSPWYGSFGMVCPNTRTNKAYDITQYSIVTCE